MFKKIQEACEELNVSRQTLYNWKNRGLLNFIKSPSGGIFINVDEAYLKIKKFYDRTERLEGSIEH